MSTWLRKITEESPTVPTHRSSQPQKHPGSLGGLGRLAKSGGLRGLEETFEYAEIFLRTNMRGE